MRQISLKIIHYYRKPDLLYGLMNLEDHKLELFRYTLSNGVTDYFDAMERV